MTSSLRRAVITGTISAVLWGTVLAVEIGGRQPSSSTLKALAVVVILAVALVPLAGGFLTLFAARQDLHHLYRRAQTLLAILLGVALIVWGLKWLSWLIDPRGNPPGMHVD